MSTFRPFEHDPNGRPSGSLRDAFARLSQILIEGLVLVMIGFAPWAYGAIHASFELLLDAGVFLLTVLWSVRILCRGKLTLQRCPVCLAIAGLFLLGIWQTTPLNRTLLEQISPAAARWYDELLPTAEEQLPFGEPRTPVSFVGTTISLYPYATRRTLQRILAVLLVFLVVRNNLDSSRAFRRLGIAVVANGACLALFAVVQFFSSPRHLLYWTYPSMGMQVFGPFIYRNHYACYMNICIGMGLGLLWSQRRAFAEGEQSEVVRMPVNGGGRWYRDLFSQIAEPALASLRLLQDPASLWICVALALMASSVILTLSRGGFVALLGGFVVCFVLQITGSVRFLRLGTAILGAAMTVGLLGWFGLARIEARYATLWGGTALEESRLALWSAAADIVKDFPVWGTGYGTCQYVDPLYRRSAEVADLTIDHLHNDHLEMLVESGVVGLLLTWLILGLVFWFGIRAVRSGGRASGMSLGAIFSMTTLVLHGFGDFLISIPAITLLATVLCAHLCNSGNTRRKSSETNIDHEGAERESYELRFHGLVPFLGAILLTTLGLLVVNQGWTKHCAVSLRQATYQQEQNLTLADLERKKDLLASAARLTPEDADLRTELADAYADLFRHHNDAVLARNKASGSASVVLLAATSSSAGSSQPVLAILPYLSLTTTLHQGSATPEEQALVQEFLAPALDNYLQARDLAPLLPGPQLGLALNAQRLTRGDPAQVYMSRVQRLAPADPTFWYYCGNQELRMGEPNKAWASWRRCLELSDRFLSPIVERSSKFLESAEVVEKVLPDRPAILAEAATRLYPRLANTKERKPFMEKALLLLDAQPAPLTAADLRTKASVYQALGRADDAVITYRDILQKEPLQVTLRYDLARVLYQDGRLEEAKDEVATVLAQQPNHAKAYELWTKIVRDLAQGK
jgi:O-antigen ligase/tetratricopeptide (TPR) repeat protein